MKFHETRDRPLFFPVSRNLIGPPLLRFRVVHNGARRNATPANWTNFLIHSYSLRQSWINLAHGSGFQLCRRLKEIALELVFLLRKFFIFIYGETNNPFVIIFRVECVIFNSAENGKSQSLWSFHSDLFSRITFPLQGFF